MDRVLGWMWALIAVGSAAVIINRHVVEPYVAAQSAAVAANPCQFVINDGRKFMWPRRADGWCYTEDLKQ